MTDVFSVTASYDKASYIQGQLITATISGGDVQTSISSSQIGPLTIPLVAADGAISTVSMPAEQATVTVATPESVVIDITKPIVDTSPTPRNWTVAANKLSISAVA
jgi:hypothetical protein